MANCDLRPRIRTRGHSGSDILRAKPAPASFSLYAKSAAVHAMVDQRQELVARLLAIPECAQHGAGDRAGVLLLDAPHHHAQVPRLADHADTLRLDRVLDRLGDLLGQP